MQAAQLPEPAAVPVQRPASPALAPALRTISGEIPHYRARFEVAAIAYVAADRRILGLRLVPGGADWVDVGPRTLAIDALAFGARGVVMAHNHPSGDPTPSAYDLAHACRLARALAAIEVRVIDHLVVATHGVVSLRAMGIV